METNVGHGRKWVCVNAQWREGGRHRSRVVQCAHFAEELWVKVTFVFAWKAWLAGLQWGESGLSGVGMVADTHDGLTEESHGCKTGESLQEERRPLACKGRTGRTTVPIFRSALTVRIPWERSEQQEGRWIWWGCIRKPGLDTSWPSFTKEPWPPH